MDCCFEEMNNVSRLRQTAEVTSLYQLPEYVRNTGIRQCLHYIYLNTVTAHCKPLSHNILTHFYVNYL